MSILIFIGDDMLELLDWESDGADTDSRLVLDAKALVPIVLSLDPASNSSDVSDLQ